MRQVESYGTIREHQQNIKRRPVSICAGKAARKILGTSGFFSRAQTII